MYIQVEFLRKEERTTIFNVEFGHLAFDRGEQVLHIGVAGKNEMADIDEFIHKASECVGDIEEYRCRSFVEATDKIEWLYRIFEDMKQKVRLDIGEPIKILEGSVTVFDNT